MKRNYGRILVNFAPIALGACLTLTACTDDDSVAEDNQAGKANSGGSAPSAGAGNGGSSGQAGNHLGGSPGGGVGPAGAGGSLGGDGGDAEYAGGAGANAEGGAGGAAGGSDEGTTELVSSSPAELVDESATDYANNEHGLITGARLKSWVEGWPAHRPAGVTGRLVVLQVVPSAATSKVHVAENSNGVVSYLLPQSALLQVRDNGLSQIEAEIPSGAATDALLKKYGIDVTRDLVVLTFEQLPAEGTTPATANSIVQSVGRAWLTLRYWGYPRERVAILNGSVNWNAANLGLPLSVSAAVAPPDDGTTSVRDLRVDNTRLVIPLGELLTTLKGGAGAWPLAKLRVVDARGGAEALGLLKSTSTGKTDCPSYTNTGTNTRCSPPFEGRIKGAKSVPWPNFLQSAADGFRFLEKADAKATFDTLSGYQAGDLTIQYCRTNMRSMVTGIVAAVVLGYPTRFYDTSFIEWSHLAYGSTPKQRVLPENSPFRTDLPSLTEHATVTGYTPGGAYDAATMPVTGWVDGPNYNDDADISPTPPLVVPNASTTAKSVTDDRAYKLP
jgi:3-mercaptopyruvate sulfurtransferase SseA